MRSHKDLEVWKAAALAARIYRATADFPMEERFGLTTQMRRAAVSIASNIAEGAARQTTKEFHHFLHMAAGSASELDTQCEIAMLAGVGEEGTLRSLQQDLDRVCRMVQGLIRSLHIRPVTRDS